MGAVTERIHISGNVLNLPLRQPAVLARSVASRVSVATCGAMSTQRCAHSARLVAISGLRFTVAPR